jgi:hypothetical protein
MESRTNPRQPRTLHATRSEVVRRLLLVVAALLLCAHAAWAQGIGTIVSMEGSVEIGRAGVWAAASAGASIELGDAIRTGSPGRVRVVFQDGSVLTVADATEFVIDEYEFEPNQGLFRSAILLLQGKLRALVSDYYQAPGAQYEIQTRNAIVGVRGTTFILTFDRSTEVAEVVGEYGSVQVHSVLDRVAHGVVVQARELTVVARGQFPTPPRRIDEARFQQYLQGFGLIGEGSESQLLAPPPLLVGALVPQEERAAAAPAGSEAAPLTASRKTRTGIAPLAPPQMPDQTQPITTPSDVVNQPVPLITKPGGLGVDF